MWPWWLCGALLVAGVVAEESIRRLARRLAVVEQHLRETDPRWALREAQAELEKARADLAMVERMGGGPAPKE